MLKIQTVVKVVCNVVKLIKVINNFTGCTKFKDGLVRHDVPNENNSDGTFCKEGGNIQHYSDSIVSTVSVEATLINLMNSNYRSSGEFKNICCWKTKFCIK